MLKTQRKYQTKHDPNQKGIDEESQFINGKLIAPGINGDQPMINLARMTSQKQALKSPVSKTSPRLVMER